MGREERPVFKQTSPPIDAAVNIKVKIRNKVKIQKLLEIAVRYEIQNFPRYRSLRHICISIENGITTFPLVSEIDSRSQFLVRAPTPPRFVFR